jgi:hypothetical protein
MCAPAPTVTELANRAPGAIWQWSSTRQSCSMIAPVLTITLAPIRAAALITTPANTVEPSPNRADGETTALGCLQETISNPICRARSYRRRRMPLSPVLPTPINACRIPSSKRPGSKSSDPSMGIPMHLVPHNFGLTSNRQTISRSPLDNKISKRTLACPPAPRPTTFEDNAPITISINFDSPGGQKYNPVCDRPRRDRLTCRSIGLALDHAFPSRLRLAMVIR